MVLTHTLAQELWGRALEAEIGIRIPVPQVDSRLAEKTLYDARRDAKNPTLDMVKLVRPGAHPDELWLVREMVVL